MSAIQDAIDVLKTTIIKGDSNQRVRDAFDCVTSSLIILSSSTPSPPQAIRKLRSVLRQPLQPLYTASLEPTLQLSSAVFSQILGEKLLHAHNISDTVSSAEWDATANIIVSGVLDFLDHNRDGNLNCNLAVARFFYPVICRYFFPDFPGNSFKLSIPLCISAYNVLSDTAVGQTDNQDMLRDKAFLGGSRLGAAISSARDYLLIEALLTLFARLIPPTYNTTQGKFKRAKFVKEVLGSPKHFKCNAELLDIMHNISSTNWDHTAARIMDVLGRSDITYPQTFNLNEIDACGCLFPQPTDADRLVMDKQGFLANVILVNSDVCESLEILYTHVRTVTVDTSEKVPDSKVMIIVDITAPPLVAGVAMDVPAEGPFYMKVLLNREDLSRFMEALRRRGVGKLSFVNPAQKTVKARQAISLATEVKFAESSSPLPPASSFEDKLRHVEEVYETEIEDPPALDFLAVANTGDGAPSALVKNRESPQHAASSIVTESETRSFAFADSVMKTSSTTSLQPRSPDVSPTKADQLSAFGDVNDELSDIVIGKSLPLEVIAVSHRNEEAKGSPPPWRQRRIMQEIKCEAKEVIPSANSSMPVMKINVDLPCALLNPVDFVPERSCPRAFDNVPMDEEGKNHPFDKDTAVMFGSFAVPDSDKQAPSGVEAAPVLGVTEPIEDREAVDPMIRQPSSIPRTKPSRKAKLPVKELASVEKVIRNRRKRELAKPSNDLAGADSEDKSLHPKKKVRKADCQDNGVTDRHAIDERVSEPAAMSLARPTKRFGRKSKSPSLVDSLQKVDFDEVPGETTKVRPSSTKPKKIRVHTTRRTRAKANRGEVTPAVGGLEQYGIAQLSSCPEQDTTDDIPCQKNGLDFSQAIIATKRSSPIACNLAPPGATYADGVVDSCENEEKPGPHESSRSGANFERAPREQIVSTTQRISSEPSANVKLGDMEEISPADNEELAIDFNTTRTKPNDGYVEFSVPRSHSEALVEVSDPPVRNLTPKKEVVTIDLTLDASPTQDQSECADAAVVDGKATQLTPRVTLASIVESEAGAGHSHTGNITERPSTPITQLPPRRKGLSVTFASPVENVVPEPACRQSRVSQRSFETRCVQTDAENEYASRLDYETSSRAQNLMDILAALPGINRASRDQSASPRFAPFENPSANHNETDMALRSAGHKATADDVDVQDIVDVLNAIQDVITKGISDKLSDVKRDVRVARDQLVQDVLDHLQDMATANSRQFNGLVSLEEEYYKHRKNAVTCWERLIECNETIALSFENALKEHDQIVSARTFPTSLVPDGPFFSFRRQLT